MPSIKMPSRRPFTSTGKQLGRCKFLMAGNSRVGKTSLVKAIVQTCEHIVHVDPIASPSRPGRSSSRVGIQPASTKRHSDSTSEITEIFASTKPYPEWWTDMEATRSSQRRKSMGDAVLERNVCFVDTPGYGFRSSAMETIIPCVEYVESHLNRVSTDALSDSDMLNMLGGDGGFQVDAVLYLISKDLNAADLEYMRRLAPITNVIPLLAHADTMTADELASSKRRIAGRLQAAGIHCFDFVVPGSQVASSNLPPSIPFAVSSATGSDHDVMDASLLMSPDYVQPLVPTELSFLLARIFSPDGSSWLRHAAAKKYLQWRDTDPSKPKHLYRPLSPPQPNHSLALVRVSDSLGRPSSSALTHLQGHYQANKEPQYRVVDWATDLQRSLATEQARYEKLTVNERAVWLTEKMNECIEDGSLVPVGGAKSSEEGRSTKKRPSRTRTQHHQDPLGLLQVAADVKARGWVALELLGGLSVVGGLAIWLTNRPWHVDQTNPVALGNEWAKVWGMDM